MNNATAIGKALKARRLAAGWSQELAAKRCKAHSRVYQDWEYGLFMPSGKHLMEVERVFRASISELAKEGKKIK